MKKVGTYNGKLCKHGHGTLRYYAGGACVVCSKNKSKERWCSRDGNWRQQRRDKYATEGGRADRRARNLKDKYGITQEQFDIMLTAQNFQCSICSVESWATGTFHVDHDHKTGKVRSLLCQKCNVAVGLCDDDPARMERAANYLREHGRI